MVTHTLPSHETARVSALARFGILDTSPEAAFDDFMQQQKL